MTAISFWLYTICGSLLWTMGDSVFLDRQNSYLVSNRFIGHKWIKSTWILLIWRAGRLNALVCTSGVRSCLDPREMFIEVNLYCLKSLNRMIHFQHCKQALLCSSFRWTGPLWVLTKITVSKWKAVSCDGTSEVTCGAKDHTCFLVSKKRLLLREQLGEGAEMRRKGRGWWCVWHRTPRCSVTTWRQNTQMWCGSRPWRHQWGPPFKWKFPSS